MINSSSNKSKDNVVDFNSFASRLTRMEEKASKMEDEAKSMREDISSAKTYYNNEILSVVSNTEKRKIDQNKQQFKKRTSDIVKNNHDIKAKTNVSESKETQQPSLNAFLYKSETM
jgi:hypothetical protein